MKTGPSPERECSTNFSISFKALIGSLDSIFLLLIPIAETKSEILRPLGCLDCKFV